MTAGDEVVRRAALSMLRRGSSQIRLACGQSRNSESSRRAGIGSSWKTSQESGHDPGEYPVANRPVSGRESSENPDGNPAGSPVRIRLGVQPQSVLRLAPCPLIGYI